MDKLKLNQETEDWLIAFFNGELDEEEQVKVGKWLEANLENREVYEALMKDYLRIRWVGESSCIREDEARKAIFSSLKKGRNPWLYYSAAASIVILFILSAFLFMREKQEVRPEQVVVTELNPIRSQAILVLSSGEKVNLDIFRQDIRESDGSVVRVDSNQGIRYDSLENVPENAGIIYNKIIVPRGGEYFVTLSDGTEIWLDAESELEFPVRFTGQDREVRLKGEAYFSVVNSKKQPFVVRSGEYSVKVYGTEFNVNAYDPRWIETVLIKGSIGFKANARSSERMLKPNQLGIVDMETGHVEIREVDVKSYVAWKNQEIVFKNERLETIMAKISRWYDVSVFFQNEELKNLRFDCNMQRYADVKDLLFFMEKTSDARFNISNRTVVINKK